MEVSGASGVLDEDMNFYVVGGSSNVFANDPCAVYCLNLFTMKWSQLCPPDFMRPTPRNKLTAWIYKKTLYLFGGYGRHPMSSYLIWPNIEFFANPGEFCEDESLGRGGYWNNQLVAFSLERLQWTNPECRGQIPSARAAHSSCMVEGNKVLIFGGRHGNRRLNDIHVLHLDTFVWTKISDKSFPEGLQVSIEGNSNCRVQTQVIDRRNGSYIVRYMATTLCNGISIRLYTGSLPIGEGVYKLKGTLIPDVCGCPQVEPVWTSELKCPESYKQIENDLDPWKKTGIDFDEVLKLAEEGWGKHTGSYSFCHYQILENQIYRKCYGEHVGFNMFSDAILLSLARKVHLPDTQFIMNLGDWPLQRRTNHDRGGPPTLIPVISWCGSNDTTDIIFPTYELTEATLNMMGRQSLDMLSVQGMRHPPWSSKIDRAFFRGRDSRQERLDLVLLSREYPQDVHAHITRFFFFRDKIDKYGPESKNIPFDQFFKYRYQLNIDGTVAAYRLPYLLGGDSLVLKQESPYYEHFYSMLQPWVHYIPLKRDLTDIREKIKWARNNQNKVHVMINNAQELVRDFLMPENIFCYHFRVIQRYTELLYGKVKPKTGMQHVSQKRPKYCPPCQNYKNIEL